MLLLHASLVNEQLFVWGESSPAARDTSQFALGSEIEAALAEVMPEMRARSVQCNETLVAWLPTRRGKPMPSPSIADLGEKRVRAAMIAPHAVETVPFGATASLALLRACAGRALLAPGVVIGHDLAYWSQLMLFAARLIAKQHVLPSISIERRGNRAAYRARWQPRLDAAARAKLTELSTRMPGACRALARAHDAAPCEAPRDVAQRFIEYAVDELVRSSVRSSDIASSDETLHDRWLGALCHERTLVVSGAELRPFAAQIMEWVRDVTRDDDADYRLCLRLEEPSTEHAPWFIRFLLQSQADQSLLIDVDDAWSVPPLRRAFLDAVGKAARLSPAIDAALREAKPIGYTLDDAGAYAFLRSEAALLSDAGCGVLLPAWWTPRGTKARIAVRARASTKHGVSAGLDMDTIVTVDWTLALGGTPLRANELAELARLKVPLVKVRGQWVIVDPDEIRAALDLRARRGMRSMRLRELTHLALTARGPDRSIEIEEVSGKGSIGLLLDRLAGRAAIEEEPVPASLRGTLRPYQVRGYRWLRFLSRLGLGACLADDMGLGKSVMALALIARDWESSTDAPVLLVCPTSVIGNWQREIARFTPDLPVIVHHGGERARDGRLLPRHARTALVVTSYGVLLRDLDLLKTVRWRGVVLDEAQNVKNADSKQAIAARALDAGYRVALTGTPIENHVGDLWSLMEFLNPGLLGTAASFRREFLIPIAALQDSEAEDRLKHATGPFVLRRLKSDPAVISDLPEKVELRVFCQLTKEQASLYAAVLRDVEESLDKAEGIERRGLILATITKLKQVCNHPAHLLRDNSRLDGRSGKLARLTEMLEEVHAAGERALVFTQFTEMAGRLQQYLRETTGRDVLYLHGALNKSERDRIVDRFQNDHDAPSTFILSLRAGGTGLNLTRATQVFHYDRWWNPAVENQASDRAYRIGQTKNVHVHRLVCAGTIEERIDDLLARKGALADRIVRSGEAGLTELSNEQLRDLFALREDAVLAL